METFDREYLEKLERDGVVFLQKSATYIGRDVKIGAGTVVYPNNHLYGATVVGKNCVLEPNNIIENCKVGEGVKITASVLKDSVIGAGTTVGPNAYVRGGAAVGDNCRIGDFVELKNARLGRGVKVSHLTYIGDADVGDETNVGCGAVFANYNGKSKFRSTVGRRCFIGSNVNLVAPVTLGDEAFIAAGTTVTEDVGEQRFVIGRSRQCEKSGIYNPYTDKRSK